jgi:hypothetical protein
MSKAPSPLLGYNNNVRHKNRMFHVQTEDSGVKHPHIITHLFMDGGRILKSVKKSYAEHVGTDGMADVVRNMMKDQHKEMLIALRDGQYDHLVDPKAAAKAAADAAAKAAAASPAPAAVAPAQADAAAPSAQAPASVAPASTGKAPSVRPPSVRPASQRPPSVRPPTSASAPKSPSVRPPVSSPVASSEAPATTRTPAGTASSELTLDIDALERAAKDAETAPMFEPKNDLPPPPQNLLRDKSVTGGYRAMTPAPDEKQPMSRPPPPSQQQPGRRPPTVPPARPGSSPPRQMPPFSAKPPGKAPPSRPGEGRYAPARPAAIFGPPSRPQPASPASSLFGEDLISDKSLDEVILSYLAEDLEPNDKKKR